MIPEQMKDLRTTETILSKEQQYMEGVSRVVLGLAASLLGGADAVSYIPVALGENPIRPRMSFLLREHVFYDKLDEVFQPAIRAAYERLWLTRLQSVCHELPVMTYNAAELWFRQQTLTGVARRPGVTLALTWFLLAVHNWIWWLVHARSQSDSRAPSHNEDDLPPQNGAWQEDISPFLDAAEGSLCGVTDLIAVHLMVVQLLRWLATPPVGRAGPAAGEGPGVGRTRSPEAARRVPDHLAESWDRIRLISPVSRLLMTEMPPRWNPAAGDKDKTIPVAKWNWLGTLLGDLGAKSLRQYLCSELAKQLSDPQASRESIHRILHVLEQVGNEIVHKPEGEDDWNCFLGQTLWATLDEMQSESLPLLWDQWAEGGPERVPLARWCGRLACRAERKARGKACQVLPDWVWTWYDLARATVGRWVIGRRKAVLCLGLWLEGYLEEGKAVPPLTLGKQACQHSLNDIIDHWLGVSQVATDNLHPQYESSDEQQGYVESVGLLAERLSRNPVITARAAEEAMRKSPVPPAERPPSGQEEERVEASYRAKIYRCT
jgi:hypothetical protein